MHLAAGHRYSTRGHSLLVACTSKREEFIEDMKSAGFLRQSLKHGQETALWESLEFVHLGQIQFKQAIGCYSHTSCILQTSTMQHCLK